jgi:hypothetical protein
MTYLSESIYLTWGGTAPSTASVAGPEVWQCGVHYAPQVGMAGVGPTFHGFSMTDVAAAVQAFHTSATTYIASDVRLEWVKAAHLKTDGDYAGEPRVEAITPQVFGGGTFAPQVLQASIAVTLDSGTNLGRAKTGRFYLPCPAVPRGTGSPFIGDLNCTNIATNAQTMLKAIAGELTQVEQAYFLAVMSKIGTGTTKAVTSIKVGNVIDTQRRRRNAITERYFSVGFPA